MEKVIVIGMDGLDPQVTDRLLGEGKLPNFKRLKEGGTYSCLGTTCPSESLVVWASFATGVNPGRHGVYDFLVHDPKTYMPSLAFSKVKTGRQKKNLLAGSIPFWKITKKHNIPTVLIHCPDVFPPDEVCGKVFSGMGTPDIRDTMGTFSFYTTVKPVANKDTGGRIMHVESKNNTINTELYGPRNGARDVTVSLAITLDEANGQIEINVSGNSFTLKPKEWSQWCRVPFKTGFLKKVRGICKFYLKSISPELELYVSPLNLDPEAPTDQITYPKNYSRQLVKEIGLYHTLGMPHDTWALNEGRIDEEVFLEQAEMILAEREKMLYLEMDNLKKGVLFCYFGTPDSIQHAFWRFTDTEHPMYDEELAGTYRSTIDRFYEKMDAILGRVLQQIDETSTLMVLSDHGFNTFRRVVHLNTWLRKNGFLFLKNETQESGGELFEDVDWSRTLAYSIGFGEIFINTIGCQGQGCVQPGQEVEAVKARIKEGLAKLHDEKFGQPVVKNIYDKNDIFWGPYLDEAPDLFIGYNIGYRASWQTALGGAPKEILEDNNKRWGGDHLFDPSLVPGVLFVNKKIKVDTPRIIDMAPTILKALGVDEKEFNDMDGKAFL